MFEELEVVILHDTHLFGLVYHQLDFLLLALLLVLVAFSDTVSKFCVQGLDANRVKQLRIFKEICVSEKGGVHFRIIRMQRIVLPYVLEKLFLRFVSLVFFLYFSI